MKFPIPNQYTYSEVNNSKGLVVFVHGLTSSQDEEMFVQGENFFNKNGFSTLRFNLYGDWPEERELNEVSLQDNIDDVNSVLSFCKSLGYKSIFLVGHSYGGIANLYVDHSNITGLLMWDSSIGGEGLLADVYEDEEGGHYIDWGDGYKHHISEKLYEDFQIPSEKFLEKMSEIHVPVKIVGAEKGLAEVARKYYECANEPKELNIILGADHRFLDGGIDELFNVSIERINKFLK